RERAAEEPVAEVDTPSAVDAGPVEEGHSHGEAPHGGVIADWGGGAYHVEFTVDHDAEEATIYILGSDAKSAAPIKADALLLSTAEPPLQVDLMPVPLDGEAEGTSSRFVDKHE